ncbi:MAG: DnaJ C-terminal domain-containing protein [Actinomycetota bacterium]
MQREWLETDFYAALGVSDDASEKDITKAYRSLARTHHPDQGGDETRFKEISAAYDVLGDPEKRAEYDELRRLGPMTGGFAGGPGGGTRQVRFEDLSDFGGGGLGDLLGNLFGRADGPGAGGARPRPTPGADLETELHLDFLDAIRGVTTEVLVGADPVKVRIPPGVDHGRRIRVRGHGRPGQFGGPPGDLFVVVQVRPHERFERRGDDLHLTVPVTYGELVLGTNLTVPTLDGPTVTVKVPPGTSTGRRFRLRGRGVEHKGRTGDLLVGVEVAVPDELDDDQRAAVEAMERALGLDPRAGLLADGLADDRSGGGRRTTAKEASS